jgi:hypothetical protein
VEPEFTLVSNPKLLIRQSQGPDTAHTAHIVKALRDRSLRDIPEGSPCMQVSNSQQQQWLTWKHKDHHFHTQSYAIQRSTALLAWVLEGGWGVNPGFRVWHQYCACSSAKHVSKVFIYICLNILRSKACCQMGVGAQRRAAQLQRQTNANQRGPTPTVSHSDGVAEGLLHCCPSSPQRSSSRSSPQ